MEETTKEKARKDLLAWCLWAPEQAVPRVMKCMKPSDFPSPDDQAIFKAMIDVYRRGEAFDLVTLSRELKGKLDGHIEKLVCLVDRSLVDESLLDRFLRKTIKVLSRRELKKPEA